MKLLSRGLTTGLILSAVALFVGSNQAHAREEQNSSLKNQPSVQQPIQVAMVKRPWRKIAGKARDIAVGGNAVWVLGVDDVKGGHPIFRYNGRSWDRIPGSASSIAVDSDGVPWVVQDNGNIYQRTGNTWSKVDGKACQVAIGGSQVYVLGQDTPKGGYGIYRWAGGRWDRLPGGGVSIGADSDGVPWITDDQERIWRYSDNKWESVEGKATQVGVGPESVWVLGAEEGPGGYRIYRWSGVWERNEGHATRIAVGKRQVWVVQDNGNIYCSDL